MTEKKKLGKGLKVFKFLISLVLLVGVVGGGVAVYGWQWVKSPLPMHAPTIEVEVERGASARKVAQDIVDAGVDVDPDLLYQFFRWSGQSHQIKAGAYEFQTGETPYSILQKLVQGSEVVRSIIFLEGKTFAQFRQRLNAAADLKHDTLDMTDEQIMAALGREGEHPEGLFFPDTYVFSKNSSDLELLRRSMQHMDGVLKEAWESRDEDIPIKTPYEALILASIIEKETGRDEDRLLVAGVFTNRLRLGMKLQTDPTVVYGVGERFQGTILRSHLNTDTPYNTYTRFGLPPTPIAMPSKKSLLAAVRPGKTKALYFVAKGNGASHFSRTNDDHVKAVNYYIKRRGNPPPPSVGLDE